MMELTIECLNSSDFSAGMAQKRDEHKDPVIRAFVALPEETLAEVAVRRLPGSGLFVSRVRKPNRDEQYE